MMFIKMMEVEGFRGFVQKEVFNLSQSRVIILYGPNGHGKTSFFDAIEWGITGKLYRYDISNDERNRAKFIANQTTGHAVPKVKLVLDHNGKEITIVRTGEINERSTTDYGKSSLEIKEKNGAKIENPEDYLTKLIVNSEWIEKVSLDNMNRMYNLTHNLGQEKITHFINDTKDGERYNSLSVMLGTDYFREYEIKFKNVKERIKKTIEERKNYLKTIDNNKLFIQKEIELLLKQMDNQEVKEKEIENLLKNFNSLFNVHISFEEDLTTLPKLLNKLNGEEIEKESILSEELRKINSALARISSANEKLSNEQFFVYKSEKLMELTEYNLFIRELEALNIRLNQLDLNRRKLSEARISHEQLTKSLYQRQKDYNRQYELMNRLKGAINQANISRNFQNVLEFTKENIIVSDYFEKASALLLILNRVCKEKQILEEQLTLKERLYNDSQKHLEDVTNLNDQYNQLLRVTFDYLENHPDLSTCPVCGTKEIYFTHIMKHMQQVGTSDDASYSELLQTSHKYKEDFKKTNEDLENKLKEISEIQINLKKVISDYEKEISTEKVEIGTLENEIKRIFEFVQMEEAKLVEINKMLNKYELPINLKTEELVYQISGKLKNLFVEVLKIRNEFNIEEKNNIDHIYDQNKQLLNEIDDEKNYLTQTMSLFGYDDVFDLVKFECFIELKKEKNKAEHETNIQRKDLISDFKTKIDSFFLLDRLKEARGKLDSYNHQYFTEQKHLEDLDNDLIIINQLIDSVPNTIDQLNKESLQKLFHLVQSIYNKINSHPLYRKVEFNAMKRYNSNRLLLNVLTEDGVESNPTYIYSAAQIRTLAISLFLAMAIKQKWTSLNFICMDDPIQSMDDLNIISFIDLMRVLVSEGGLNKQFIISTHNSNFYDMLRKKFRMFDIGLIQYDSYGKNGPVFNTDQGKFMDEGVVMHEISKYDMNIRHQLTQFFNEL